MQIVTSLIPHTSSTFDAIDVAVVIDVLRATSVAATALAAGATEILTCRDVDRAPALAAQSSPAALLCGERGCRPIAGFDLGNSPAEYTEKRVAGRRLVLTTTNGTRAIESAAPARQMVLASFLNVSAIVDAIIHSNSVHLVCAGTEGQVTGEDILLAGLIVDRCIAKWGAVVQACDASRLARQWWRGSMADRDIDSLTRCLAQTAGGRNLIRVGYRDDLARCASIDSLTCVPRRTHRNPATFVAG